MPELTERHVCVNNRQAVLQIMAVAAAAALSFILSHTRFNGISSCRVHRKLSQCHILPHPVSMVALQILGKRFVNCRTDAYASCSGRVGAHGAGYGAGAGKEDIDHFSSEKFLSVLELMCIAPCTIFSIRWIVNCGILSSLKLYQPLPVNGIFMWQFTLLVGAVAIGSFLRRKKGQKVFRNSYNSGDAGCNLVDKVEALNDDVKSSATIVRTVARQLEKLGIRFRLTRKTLKGLIAEISDLGHTNSEAIKALTIQKDLLKKELHETQNILLAMQEQQQKQLELIVRIGRYERIRGKAVEEDLQTEMPALEIDEGEHVESQTGKRGTVECI